MGDLTLARRRLMAQRFLHVQISHFCKIAVLVSRIPQIDSRCLLTSVFSFSAVTEIGTDLGLVADSDHKF